MASLLQILLLFACINFISSSSAEIIQKELRSKESSRIDPSRVVQLSWQPRNIFNKWNRVFVYKDFLSEEECDYLIALAEDTNSLVNNTQGLSARSLVSLDVKDEIVARIEEKISAWTLLPLENSKSLHVQRYRNEEAKQKYDYFGNRSAWQVREPSMATVILYLSDVPRGGELSFPESPVRSSRLESKVWSFSTNYNSLLRPIKGNAVLFFHVHPNASPDKESRHERDSVSEGELWCATKFFHIRAINTRHLPAESVDSDCSDEDENCPQWAALGECEKNSVFMVGSPDYYGTCRKSCNVC